MNLAVAANCQPKHFGQRVDATHAHTMQTTGDLVAVLIELSACMQFGQGYFGSRAFRLVLIIHFDAGRYAATVVCNTD